MLRKSTAGIITAILVLTSTAAKAEDFETTLKSSLTPAEAQVHQQRGNARALQLARETCTALDAGTALKDFAMQVAQSLAKEELTAEQLETTAQYTGKVIGFGVASFCPQHLSQLQELQQ